jgi:hypothetical protein
MEAKVSYLCDSIQTNIHLLHECTDVDLGRFSVAHMKEIIGSKFHLEEGYLRVSIRSQYFGRSSCSGLTEEDDDFGDEDDRLLAVMEQFKAEANQGGTAFVMQYEHLQSAHSNASREPQLWQATEGSSALPRRHYSILETTAHLNNKELRAAKSDNRTTRKKRTRRQRHHQHLPAQPNRMPPLQSRPQRILKNGQPRSHSFCQRPLGAQACSSSMRKSINFTRY